MRRPVRVSRISKRPFSGRQLESARTICSTGVPTLVDDPFMRTGGSTSAPGFMPSTMVKQIIGYDFLRCLLPHIPHGGCNRAKLGWQGGNYGLSEAQHW